MNDHLRGNENCGSEEKRAEDREIQMANEQELNSDLYLSNAIILIIRLHA